MMDDKLPRIVFFLLIVGFSVKKVSSGPKYLYGLLIDFEDHGTFAKVYEMEVKPELAQFPIRKVESIGCKWFLDLTKTKDNIVYDFTKCLEMFISKTIDKKKPENVFAVLTGSEYLDQLRALNKDKLKGVMHELAKVLTKRNYGMEEKGYYQPLKNTEEITFLAMAAQYDDMAKNVNKLFSTVSYNPYSIHFIHPTETKMSSSSLFDSITVNIFDKIFNMNAVNLKCLGAFAITGKYYFQIVKEASSSRDKKQFISPCHINKRSINLENFKSECNKGMHDEMTPSHADFEGSMDVLECEKLLKKVFCDGFPKNIPCPIDGSNPNVLLPSDKKSPIYFGGDYRFILERHKANDASELLKNIHLACFPENKEIDESVQQFCLKDIYSSIILNHFTHDIDLTVIIPQEKTWELGKMLQLSRDIKEQLYPSRRNLIIAITVTVTLVLLVVVIGWVIYRKRTRVKHKIEKY